MIELNPFHATCLFLYLLKTWENLTFCDVFRIYIKRPVAWNSLNVVNISSLVKFIIYNSSSHFILLRCPLTCECKVYVVSNITNIVVFCHAQNTCYCIHNEFNTRKDIRNNISNLLKLNMFSNELKHLKVFFKKLKYLLNFVHSIELLDLFQKI